VERKGLISFLNRFSRSRILVVGDIMLDEYVRGSVERISPEAPIPVVNICNGMGETRLGGSANVFNNLFSLGAKHIYLCGIIGADANGEVIKNKVRSIGLETEGLVVEQNRPTTVKTRIIAHNQQVIRLDKEEISPIRKLSRQQLIEYIEAKLDTIDAIIFSDYEKGVITEQLLKEVLPHMQKRGLMVAVDPKFSNFRHFKKATIIVPNRKEASGFCRHELNSQKDVLIAAQYILQKLDCECVLIKMGEHGMMLVDKKANPVSIKTVAEQVYDVTGAGDTVIGVLTMARTAGASWEEAAIIANYAAGIVIHYLGTTIVSLPQLKNAILKNRFPKP
jgi:D-beta-D-heptose 7-phosphate kinase/D-beta-D-heptose 1-phosphate adenosyltransferase